MLVVCGNHGSPGKRIDAVNADLGIKWANDKWAYNEFIIWAFKLMIKTPLSDWLKFDLLKAPFSKHRFKS